MKKIVLLIVVLLTVFACGSSKTIRTSHKVIKGNWTLTNITYSEYGTFKITFFRDVSKECFEGSNWQFIPNNNTGTYTITNAQCYKGDRNFIFTIQEIDAETGLYDFLLKPTNAKHKSEDNKGFRVKLEALSDDSMQWTQTASIDDKTIKINMNFSKITGQ